MDKMLHHCVAREIKVSDLSFSIAKTRNKIVLFFNKLTNIQKNFLIIMHKMNICLLDHSNSTTKRTIRQFNLRNVSNSTIKRTVRQFSITKVLNSTIKRTVRQLNLTKVSNSKIKRTIRQFNLTKVSNSNIKRTIRQFNIIKVKVYK